MGVGVAGRPSFRVYNGRLGSVARSGHADATGCDDPTHCCTGYSEPNDDWLYNSIDQFSAA